MEFRWHDSFGTDEFTVFWNTMDTPDNYICLPPTIVAQIDITAIIDDFGFKAHEDLQTTPGGMISNLFGIFVTVV